MVVSDIPVSCHANLLGVKHVKKEPEHHPDKLR